MEVYADSRRTHLFLTLGGVFCSCGRLTGGTSVAGDKIGEEWPLLLVGLLFLKYLDAVVVCFLDSFAPQIVDGSCYLLDNYFSLRLPSVGVLHSVLLTPASSDGARFQEGDLMPD